MKTQRNTWTLRIAWIFLFLLMLLLSQTTTLASLSESEQGEQVFVSNPQFTITPTPLPDRGYRESPPPAKVGGQSITALAHSGNGPFGPPTTNDTTFTEDDDSTMDEYRYRDQSPILFTIPVDRYVGGTDSNGYLTEPDKLIQNGIISAKAHLQLLVWDVDEDYTGSDVVREIDRVYVNGNYVGNLTGANQTWSVTSFDVDIRYLKFASPTCGGPLSSCNSPPTTAENEIRIDIDTGNTGD